MVRIARCESGLDPHTVGDSLLPSTVAYKALRMPYGESIGIFQIRLLPGRPGKEFLQEVDHNIAYAKQLLDARKYQPWSCARRLGIN